MEFDKLRGDYKEAMESIDLSKDSRDRILSNIRLEDLSIPAENVKAKKRVPLFVVIPVATALFAALIVAGIVISMGSSGMMKNMSAAMDAEMADTAKAEKTADNGAIAGGAEEQDTDAAVDAELDMDTKNYVPFNPAGQNSYSMAIGDVDSRGIDKLGADCPVTLNVLPFADYKVSASYELKTKNSVKVYVNNLDSEERIVAFLDDQKSDSTDEIQSTVVAGHEVIFRGFMGKITNAEYKLADDKYVFIESTKDYELDQWVKIVEGVVVSD